MHRLGLARGPTGRRIERLAGTLLALPQTAIFLEGEQDQQGESEREREHLVLWPQMAGQGERSVDSDRRAADSPLNPAR